MSILHPASLIRGGLGAGLLAKVFIRRQKYENKSILTNFFIEKNAEKF